MPCWLSSFRCFPGCTAAQDLLQGQLAGGVELQGHEAGHRGQRCPASSKAWTIRQTDTLTLSLYLGHGYSVSCFLIYTGVPKVALLDF